jgi:hypothetical protein
MPKAYELTPRGLSVKDIPGEKTAVSAVKVYFHTMAFAKMALLIDRQEKEVAWHGLVSRKAPHVYEVEDVQVYPQTVSGVTANTDQIPYQNWLMGFDTDAFNMIKMQGHSHVNMTPHPSGDDFRHQSKIVAMLEGDMFYIFMIWNKAFDYSVFLFEAGEKMLYSGGEVRVDVLSAQSSPMEFLFNRKNTLALVSSLQPQLVGFYEEAADLIRDCPSCGRAYPGNGRQSVKEKAKSRPPSFLSRLLCRKKHN